ncbi:Ubiquinone/menaquinone biosynthesis C-methyltransferase UbiE [uncultured archaeon]|nr:Ubiquinone/menaquinone biosynthesis C-methyltransferase UbiE [uncultured archaeon]
MKVSESGMPEKDYWESFFKPKETLAKLGLTPKAKDVVDVGSGYGTFTLPAAAIVSGVVYAYDVEAEMISALEGRAKTAGVKNVRCVLRDVIEEGTGLSDKSVDYVMLFNILHGSQRKALLAEAFRILTPAGKAGVLHWNFDPNTPRGPPMHLRSKPPEIILEAEAIGFRAGKIIDVPPYHYGIILEKP